jgi:succinate-semialdehyde dehydrogenase/glutarate-semialdehyde dehydrogenase
MRFRSINPYDGRLLNTYEGQTEAQTQQTIELAYQVQQSWCGTDFEKRSMLMNAAARELQINKYQYSRTITLEMGKTISESLAEIEKCASVCTYYAGLAERFLADEPLEVPHGAAFIQYQPLGVVLAVMPWNFPFWQVFRFAAPALMAGNGCLLKHASNVPQCALDIERVFLTAGFPNNIFNTLLIGSKEVQAVIENPKVAAVTLTGSEPAGSSVASVAGRHIKKSVLELGGSDAFIVLKDANLAKAAEAAVKGRMLNAGQSCIAAKRFIIEDEIVDGFTALFIEELEKLKPGNPLEMDTSFATLARKELGEELLDQVKRSLKLGATLIYGELPNQIESAFFPPLIMENVKPGMPAYDEELFGPVASFVRVQSQDEAIQIANDSNFGLGGSLWTGDVEKGRQLAKKIESGAVYINQMMFSHPSVPFGGIKTSGYGRELAHLGIREFTNQKTIWAAS